MEYEIKKYDHLLGLAGFSDQLLKNHFTLYEGYVNNTNKLLKILDELKKAGKAASPEFAELKRRFGWEFNGMRLHEYYFGNIKKGGSDLTDSDLKSKIVEDFGSYQAWEEEFKSTGAIRGIGWVVLAYDCCGKRLHNVWVNEHDVGHLAGTRPLLIMDVFEHAFMLDYGLKRADYIQAFFKGVDWEAVVTRYGKSK